MFLLLNMGIFLKLSVLPLLIWNTEHLMTYCTIYSQRPFHLNTVGMLHLSSVARTSTYAIHYFNIACILTIIYKAGFNAMGFHYYKDEKFAVIVY